eukprot:5651329-Pyramimonas_sp.AAC.1
MRTNPEREAIVQQRVLDAAGIQTKRTKWAKYLGVDCAMGMMRTSKTTKTRMTVAQGPAVRTALFRRIGR